MAVERSDFFIVDKLLQKGADVNCTYKQQPLLHTVIATREEADFNCSIKKMLLKYPGANINAKNSDGETLLHVAVKYNELECLKLLIEKSGHLYTKNNKGQSILFYAVWYEEWGVEVLQLLLVRGFYNINEKDVYGNTILHGLHPGTPEETARCETLYYCFLYGANILI